MKKVFPSSGNVNFNESFILVSGNGFLLFRALLKFWKFGGGNFFYVFSNEFFIPYCEDGFLSHGNRFFLFNIFYGKWKTTEISRNPFFGKKLYSR